LRYWLLARLREMHERAAKNAKAEAAAAAMLDASSPQPMRERRIYPYAHPDNGSERIDIARELYPDDIMALTATQTSGGRGLPDWLREGSSRIGKARECEALALLRVSSSDVFVTIFSISASSNAKASQVRAALRCRARCSTGPTRAGSTWRRSV
jgi:hypothetical protein